MQDGCNAWRVPSPFLVISLQGASASPASQIAPVCTHETVYPKTEAHPVHRMKVPKTTRVVEWPRQSGFTLPSMPKRPRRGPQKKAEMIAVMPPSMWMTLHPAKSIMPMPRRGLSRRSDKKPLLDQSLHPRGWSDFVDTEPSLRTFSECTIAHTKQIQP
jgi:hypothetical protein